MRTQHSSNGSYKIQTDKIPKELLAVYLGSTQTASSSNGSYKIQTDEIPQELLAGYLGSTQSTSLMYGIPNIWESPDIQYDMARSVPDPVRRYNTPAKNKTEKLGNAIYGICQQFAAMPQVSVQDEGGQFLIQGFLYLQILVKSISATDFIIGMNGKAIVERGAERSERKGELTAILQRIQVSELALDWSDLISDERFLIAALSIFALKGSDKTIEEINRITNVYNLPMELAKRLTILETNLKDDSCFSGSGSQLLESITRYPELQNRMQQVCRLTSIHINQGTRKELFLPEEMVQPDPSTIRIAADILGISPDINLCTVNEEQKRNIFVDVLQRLGSLDRAVAIIIKHATNEFCDDFTVMQRTKNRPFQQGDTIVGFACILGIPWRIDSFCSSDDPIKIKPKDLIMIPVESNKAPRYIWQRRPEDLEDVLYNGDPQRLAILCERQAAIRIEQKIKLEGVSPASLDAEELSLLQLAAKRYQSRLWVYNQGAVANGKQTSINGINLIFNASFDVDGGVNNQPHAISGVQSGIRMPFGYFGNIRFWNESRRPECEMGLGHIPVAKAYAMIIRQLYQAAGIID